MNCPRAEPGVNTIFIGTIFNYEFSILLTLSFLIINEADIFVLKNERKVRNDMKGQICNPRVNPGVTSKNINLPRELVTNPRSNPAHASNGPGRNKSTR